MKTLKAILILAIILLATLSQAQTSILAKEITVNRSQITSYQLIAYLQKETGFSINYSCSVLKISKNIKLDKNTATFKYFLDKIFGQQQVEYIVKGQKILVKPKPNNKSNKTSLGKEHFINIQGKVTEKQSQKAIAYASISIKNKAIGTVSNTEGSFVFHIPKKYQNDTLVVSSIGYKSYTIKTSDISINKLEIELEKQTYDLMEVNIKPIEPLELLKQAIAEIPKNYSTTPIYYDAFYRTLMKEDTSYIKLTEASCIFHYSKYTEKFNIDTAQKKHYAYTTDGNCNIFEGLNNYFDVHTSPDDQLKIIESRISEDNSGLFISLPVVGGPLNLIASDKVKFTSNFMDKNHFKHYKYRIDGRTSFNNKEVIIISFKPKPIQFRDRKSYLAKRWKRHYYNAEFIGKIYLDLESLAFIRIDYKIVKVSLLGHLSPNHYTVRLDYKNNNDKWYLSQVLRKRSHDRYFKKHINNDSISVEEQLIVNRIRTNEIEKFKEDEIFPNSAYFSLYKYPMSYNQEFWNKYNIVTDNKLSQKAINDLEKNKPLEQQYRDMQVKNDSLPMPEAPIQDYKIKIHDKTIVDEYKWLENFGDKNVQKYLKEENRFTYNYFIPLRKIQKTLFKEMATKLPKRSYMYDKKKNGNYNYYQKDLPFSEYPLLCRKKDKVDSKEEIIFDFNKLARKYDYFALHFIEISPDNNHIAIGIDKDGSEHKTCFFINTTQKTIEKDSIKNIWALVWANDSKTFFYVIQDSLNRPSSLYKHKLGQDFSNDKLIYHEKDKYFDVDIRKSGLGNYIFLEIFDYNTTEIRYINANKPNDSFKIFHPREQNHFYSVKEAKDEFYIISNKDAFNNRLFKCPKDNIRFKSWKEIVVASKDTLLKNFYVCEDFLILSEIHNVQKSLRIIDLNKNKSKNIRIKQEFYSLELLEHDYYSDNLKISVSSFDKPQRIYEYNMNSNKMKLLKKEIIKDYSHKDYMVERVWSTSDDGTKIPITLVYKKKYIKDINGFKIKKKIKLDGSNPLILEAYGSFGNGNFPHFSIDKLSMLDRGFIYALAHVRGGNELGNAWHNDGKLLNKKNTFNDYIACAEYLINKQYTNNNLLFGLGGSAGGLLMGAVANKNPELFKGIILEYPQVCQLDALMDSTTMNHQEFGNPYKKTDFEYIYSYSPYENIKKQKYPAMLLISGLKDERVRYWQATKMVAKLRKHNTGNSPILLKSYNSGHTGASGRYAYYRSMAFEYSFFLSLTENNIKNK